ncbi:kinase-like domain-containing protein [Xylariales sp. PMI_506]|nr:kinase-like domain-containing protein [Xylariales sp. PMI_506]
MVKSAAEIKSEVLGSLKGTPFAATTLEPLSGGSACFIYKAPLEKALDDGTAIVCVKHGEGYMAAWPDSILSVHRCNVEEKCLTALESFRVDTPEKDGFTVRTPNCYTYDEINHTLILEFLSNGINLRAYLLNEAVQLDRAEEITKFHQLGNSLAQYITGFHKTSLDPDVYASIRDHKDMQNLKHHINYNWMLQRVDKFPSILGGAKEIFKKIKMMAEDELKGDLVPIHGDYWTANILVPDNLHESTGTTQIFIVDWETAQLGVPCMEHGELLGDLYALWQYKKIHAARWLIQGYVEGLGDLSEDAVWRLILQVGVHLIAFGTVYPNMGSDEQVEDCARLGRDVIMNAWERNAQWFENSELAGLFTDVMKR